MGLRLYDYAASANCFKVRLLLRPARPALRARRGRHLRRGHAHGRVRGDQSAPDHAGRRPFLVGERYTIADIAVYGYAHAAHDAGLDSGRYAAFEGWLARVATQPAHVNDLAPYPENARPGAGASIYD